MLADITIFQEEAPSHLIIAHLKEIISSHCTFPSDLVSLLSISDPQMASKVTHLTYIYLSMVNMQLVCSWHTMEQRNLLGEPTTGKLSLPPTIRQSKWLSWETTVIRSAVHT